VRTDVDTLELVSVGSVSEACERVRAGYRPLAGGTDVMVLLAAGKLPHGRWVDIWGLDELRGVEVRDDAVVLGALTTYTEVRRHPLVSSEFPMLAQAARETGGAAIQNRGTLGGNIANASPAADSPPALLVYDAELELVSTGGSRWVPYHSFWFGYKQTGLRPDELIRRIRLPRNKRTWKQYYRKVGTRRAQAISKVCVAAAAHVDAGRIVDVRIALGSVAPTVLRARETEKMLRGEKLTPAIFREAQDVLVREIAPIDDMRSTAQYRRMIARNLLAEFCETIS
jgi:CO/xanthine dehydrogenase FAD-binding subunit